MLGTAISFETEPPSVGEMAERIFDTLNTYPWLVYERDRGIAGYAHACTHRARALYSGLFDCLRLQGYANAFAGITLPNPASVAFHESMGFQPIGTFPKIGFKGGVWHDTGWWSLRLIDHDAPTEPRPLRECHEGIEVLLREESGVNR